MRPDAPCTKCGSTKMAPRASLVDRDALPWQGIGVAVQRSPENLLFKGEERNEIYARVCGECGFIELFATDPAALYEAYLESKRKE
jgi:hypothetical protein